MEHQNPMIVFDLDDTLHMRSAPFANAVQELCHIADPGQLCPCTGAAGAAAAAGAAFAACAAITSTRCAT